MGHLMDALALGLFGIEAEPHFRAPFLVRHTDRQTHTHTHTRGLAMHGEHWQMQPGIVSLVCLAEFECVPDQMCMRVRLCGCVSVT